MIESVLLFLAKIVTIIIGVGLMLLPIYLLFTFIQAIYMDIKGCNKHGNKNAKHNAKGSISITIIKNKNK